MDKAAPSMLKATLIGGTTAGIVASIPILGALNCLCCSLVIAGGFLAAFLYSKDCRTAGVEFRPGSGAMVGLVAGMFYAIAGTVASAVVRILTPGGYEEQMEQVVEQLEGMDLPPETLDTVERVMELFGSWIGILLLFCITLLIAAVFSTVGGLIGGAVFKVEPHPESPGPPAPSHP